MLWLNIFFLCISVLLIGVILVQNRSAGLGGAFGGSGSGFHIRRGGEKRIFQATVILGVLFILTAIAHLFLK